MPEDALVLTLALDRRFRSPKVKEAIETRPHRWTHHIVLSAASQLDAEVLGWMRKAYLLGASRVAKNEERPPVGGRS